MMSILIAGRVGSAMTAELGSMRVYQEIDALRTRPSIPITWFFPGGGHRVAVPRPWDFRISSAGWAEAIVAAHNERIAVPRATFFASLRQGVDISDVVNGSSNRSASPFASG